MVAFILTLTVVAIGLTSYWWLGSFEKKYDPRHNDCKCETCYRDHMNQFKANLPAKPTNLDFWTWADELKTYTERALTDHARENKE